MELNLRSLPSKLFNTPKMVDSTVFVERISNIEGNLLYCSQSVCFENISFCCRTLVRCRYVIRFVIIYCKWYQLEPIGIYNRIKLWKFEWLFYPYFVFLLKENSCIPQLISKRQSITDQLQTWGCFHISFRLRVIRITKDPTVTV